MARIEVYVIVKEEGTCLTKYDFLGDTEETKDQLVSGFLTALNSFAKEIGFPKGVSLIRSGSLEARFSPGKNVFTVLIIDYFLPLGLMAEPILSSLAREITETFEKKFKKPLNQSKKGNIYKTSEFHGFRGYIDDLLDKYGRESLELYQKLILVECLYDNVPEDIIIPILTKVTKKQDVLSEFKKIPKKFQKIVKNAIKKINYRYAPLWQIFAIPTLIF
ncbi:hypothetical protein DSAG12_01220 [Promethearchaeum syntrophicum]|uniref:Longin domain-containing protein n=1 Tax=Promethearchaeum syntrophicum TaxID=2594042 RepID=A0A5B9D8R7_9ARCH|nr:hypothetical protein [Candidatus Prometheoarchaeum syntrophicum]QEE15395.1 hypothetical protein DSAG12_01220 [Candidatus Prometheoarchaeum syntrophicum]